MTPQPELTEMARAFSTNLKAIRAARSQLEFAKLLGIATQVTYHRYEHGRIPPAAVLARLAAILGATVDELLAPMSQERAAQIGAQFYSPVEEQSQSFAERLQGLMQAQGLTQIQLAKTLGVTQSAVSNYLNGRIPPTKTFLKLARLFGKTPSELFEGEQAKSSVAPPAEKQAMVPASPHGKVTNKAFAAQLQKLRQAKGLSQAALARAVGITHTAIGHYLRGRVPTPEILQRLGEFFGVNLSKYLPARQSPAERDLYKISTVRHKMDCGEWQLTELIRAGELVVVDIRAPGKKSAALRVTAKSYAAYLERLEKAAAAKRARIAQDESGGSEASRPGPALQDGNAKASKRFAKASPETPPKN